MKASIVLVAIAATFLASCASSSITRLSKNRAVVSTSAAPVCRTTGAATVANQMAAITTLKSGYERFIVLGIGTANNTRLVSTGPTYSNTTGSFNQMGNTVYGTAHTTYGGQMTYLAGSNNAEMELVMLNRGDPGFEEGLDARETLGPEWQKKLEKGINTCF
ncbi:MAG TPA: hypothetical protein VIN06_16565 [Devosia sp.]